MSADESTISDEELVEDFWPIMLEALVDGTTPKFSLYIQPELGKRPVLYREQNLPFDGEVKNRLLGQNVKKMFIPSEEKGDYHAYMENYLGTFLDNPTIHAEEKAQMLYGTAVHVCKELLENPETSDLPVRAHNIITNSVEFIYTQKLSFEHFLKAGNFDYQTYTHSVQVMLYSLYLAEHLGHTDVAFFHQLALATFLHDIGKSRIPREVLQKTGALDDEEWKMMKKHPEWGCEILSKHGINTEMVVQIVRSHHEKLDGTGYPDGLKSDEITEVVKMVTICDIFDALTTRRSYKDAMGTFQAFKIFQEEMDGQVDKSMLITFIKMLSTIDEKIAS
jgi:putative nucleotidyltransferase with HDIG domain